MNTIGERLKKYIQRSGFSIKDFATKYDLNISTLSKNINDNKIPGGEVLTKLLSTGLNINWLLTGVGDMVLLKEECLATIPIPLADSVQHFLLNTEALLKMTLAKPWHWFGCGVVSNTHKDISLEKGDFLILRKIVDDYSRQFPPAQSRYALWYSSDSNSEFASIDTYHPIDDPYDEIATHEYKLIEYILRESAYAVEFVIRRPVIGKIPDLTL